MCEMANGSEAPAGSYSVPAASALAATAVDARAVECASRLFLERGIDAVKMTDIAEAAGMGVATLYRHFSTKAAVALAASMRMLEHLLDEYASIVASDAYQQLDGASRLELLLSTYCDQYVYRPGFAAFIDELDRLILAGAVSSDAVLSYTRMLASIYPHFEAAYQLGCTDGSIMRRIDFELFYRSVAHALMSVASKLSRGEVLPSDDFSASRDELDCLVDIAIRSLRIKG